MTKLVWVDECQNSHFGLKLLVGFDYAQPTGTTLSLRKLRSAHGNTLSPEKCRPQPQPTRLTRRLSAAETGLSMRIRSLKIESLQSFLQ